jgi:hypothetical protein
MTITKDSVKGITGRTQLNDIEAILDIPEVNPEEISHFVKTNADSIFTWDYSSTKPQLHRLYEKAKAGQWNGNDLPWDTDVDIEKVVAEEEANLGLRVDISLYQDSPIAKWGEKEWLEFGIESRRWVLSQTLHGEQGAMICASKIVETVPWWDAKLYASTQVVDEARHAEVFNRYISEKMGDIYPVNWHMTYLGMQVMLEGLALASFGHMYHMSSEPLLKKLLRQVMIDESRHVAFGTLSLKDVYENMTDAEIKDRQDFAYESCIYIHDRIYQYEVFENMGVKPKDIIPILIKDPVNVFIHRLSLAKIVPSCKNLGLLDRNDGWLRKRFEELGIIGFENENAGDELPEGE